MAEDRDNNLPAVSQQGMMPAVNVGGSYAVDVAVARALAETQAAMMIAQDPRFRRNLNESSARIREHCRRLSFAHSAFYTYKRGKELVDAPTIRVAEMLARELKHIAWSWEEVESRRNETLVKTWAWDRETNTYVSRVFTVKHERHTREGVTRLTDPRDIYEMIANLAARRVRACLLNLVPADIVDMAIQECKQTLSTKGGNEPLIDRVRLMASGFSELGISIPMIEGYLGHSLDVTIESEVASLRKIYAGIRDGVTTREDFFDLTAGTQAAEAQGTEPAAATKTEALKRRLRKKPEQTTEPPPAAGEAGQGGSSSPPSVPPAAGGPGNPAELFPVVVGPSVVDLRTMVMGLKGRCLKVGVEFDKMAYARLRCPVSATADAAALSSLLDGLTAALDNAEPPKT